MEKLNFNKQKFKNERPVKVLDIPHLPAGSNFCGILAFIVPAPETAPCEKCGLYHSIFNPPTEGNHHGQAKSV